MAALGGEAMELGDPAVDIGQTRILISHFKENAILWISA